jgi:hypothetical protein
MNLFGKIVRTVVNTALIPVEVAKDVVTLGGVATDRHQTYTAERIDKLIEDTQD